MNNDTNPDQSIQDVNSANLHMSEIRLAQQKADAIAGLNTLPIIPKPEEVEVVEDVNNPNLITSADVPKPDDSEKLIPSTTTTTNTPEITSTVPTTTIQHTTQHTTTMPKGY
jgi:hypothetical protein